MASTSAATEKKKMYNLKSSDGHTFQLDEAAASMSLTIKNMIEDISDGEDIPLPNVDGATLAKVCEYCKHHTAPPENETVSEFDKKLVEELKDDQPMLFDLILAANYLSLTQLLNLTCQCVADMMKGRDPDEIRKIFHIKNDYTDEELEEVKRENSWAFE